MPGSHSLFLPDLGPHLWVDPPIPHRTLDKTPNSSAARTFEPAWDERLVLLCCHGGQEDQDRAGKQSLQAL